MQDARTFSLAPYVYAAHFDASVIILDVKNDKYISLVGDAARALSCIIDQGYGIGRDRSLQDTVILTLPVDKLNYYVTEFKRLGFIVEKNHFSNARIIAPSPLKSGGLCDYKWDTKVNWQPFKNASLLGIVRTFWTLLKVNALIKKGGMQALFEILKVAKKTTKPTQGEVDELVATVDAATKLYYKKTYCLGWASTFVIEALKRGWFCRLVIGVQTTPFYAHAWAELENGTIVHDDPQIAKVLSIIVRKPE